VSVPKCLVTLCSLPSFSFLGSCQSGWLIHCFRIFFTFFAYLSYHPTYTTAAERGAEEPLWRQRRQHVAIRPKVASNEKTRSPPVSRGSFSCWCPGAVQVVGVVERPVGFHSFPVPHPLSLFSSKLVHTSTNTSVVSKRLAHPLISFFLFFSFVLSRGVCKWWEWWSAPWVPFPSCFLCPPSSFLGSCQSGWLPRGVNPRKKNEMNRGLTLNSPRSFRFSFFLSCPGPCPSGGSCRSPCCFGRGDARARQASRGRTRDRRNLSQ